MKKEKKDYGGMWLVGIAIMLLGASLFLNISKIVITNESIVLTFVGILATFIVVGNFAQVSEIRNITRTLIRDLEKKTQTKIEELEKLHDKLTDATRKLEKIEKQTNFISAEAYRLFGNVALDKKRYRLSTAHYISAIINYYLAEDIPKEIEIIFNTILNNLKPENWNNTNQPNEFNYKLKIYALNAFPDSYEQKQKIVDILTEYEKESLKNEK